MSETVTRKLGLYGAAYDGPGPQRAYTFQHQPSNGGAYQLGCALREAKLMQAGDDIDIGLALLKALEKRGFGVFEVEPRGDQP